MTLEEKRVKTVQKLEALRNIGSIPKIIFEVSQAIKSDPGNSYKLAGHYCPVISQINSIG
jgi:hypothetical protein